MRNPLRRRRPRVDSTPEMIVGCRAARAVFVDEDTQEVELDLVLEGGRRIKYRIKARHARGLIDQMTTAYQAINPPLSRGDAANWIGMGGQ